jgi:hypothetical protein
MIVIYEFLNDPGFGDNIRGLYCLLELISIRPVYFYVDFSKSSIYPFIKHRLPEDIVNLQCDTFQIMHDGINTQKTIKDIIKNSSQNIRINTNIFPVQITSQMKTYVKTLFNFTDDFLKIYNDYREKLPESYKIYHFRYGDDIFKDDIHFVDNNTIKLFQDLYNNKEDVLVISDSFNLKKTLNSRFDKHIYTFLNKPSHTNNSDNSIDIFIDLFLIANSSAVYGYSYYPWISNFILWIATTNDINLVNLKDTFSIGNKIICEKYDWEGGNVITFIDGKVNLSDLIYGTYYFNGLNTINAFFGDFYHSIKFNDNYTAYKSTRSDGHVVEGNVR